MSSLSLEITYSPDAAPTNGTWFRGYERGDTDWTEASDYYYRWSGGKNGKVRTDANGNPTGYEFDTDETKPWDIVAKSAVLIREVIFCDVDSLPPNIPDSRKLGSQIPDSGNPMFKTYPKSGSWAFKSGDATTDAANSYQHHVWVWAQKDKDSPIIRCDPMVHNNGGGN